MPAEELTVTVFQKGLVARTFRVQRSWFYRLSLSALILVLLTVASVWVAVRYFRIAMRLDPARLHDLELELTDAKTQNRMLEQRAADLEAAQRGAVPITGASLTPGVESSIATPTLPAPTVTVTVTAAAPPPPAAPMAGPIVGASGSYLFTALPANVQTPPDRATLPIALKEAKVRWSGNQLRVRFALQYTQAGGGAQQGRLILLARGKDTLQIYPNGAFTPSNQGTLINPERGESFSVSRYREVKAEFGPAKTRESFQEVEALIFDSQGKLLIHERLVPEKSEPKPVTTEEPKANDSGNPAQPPL